jgi:hypothetical protein
MVFAEAAEEEEMLSPMLSALPITLLHPPSAVQG